MHEIFDISFMNELGDEVSHSQIKAELEDIQEDITCESEVNAPSRCFKMELEDDNVDVDFINAATDAAMGVLPTASKNRYNRVYDDFQRWKTSKFVTSISQKVLMTYFSELAKKHRPTTLLVQYSMLKATLKINDDVDIANYHQLTAFLKTQSSGYIPAKANIFTEDEIEKFINGAPDELWLDVKVACIFGVSGGCRTHELGGINVDDIKAHGHLYLVTIRKTITKVERSFTISGTFFNVVQKYASMRAKHTNHKRFFVNYQRGKCTTQVIGRNKFCRMPRRIATYLNLVEPERYTGHSFRRTSTTMVTNVGALIPSIKQHGIWSSTKVAEQYIEDSRHHNNKTGDIIMSSITDVTQYGQSKTSKVTEGNVQEYLGHKGEIGTFIAEEIRLPSMSNVIIATHENSSERIPSATVTSSESFSLVNEETIDESTTDGSNNSSSSESEAPNRKRRKRPKRQKEINWYDEECQAQIKLTTDMFKRFSKMAEDNKMKMVSEFSMLRFELLKKYFAAMNTVAINPINTSTTTAGPINTSAQNGRVVNPAFTIIEVNSLVNTNGINE